MNAQQPQSPARFSKSQVDPGVAIGGQTPQEVQHDPPMVSEKPDPRVKASEENTPTVTGNAKEAEGSDDEVETPTEAAQPPSAGPSTPIKKRPTSTRASEEIFKTPPNKDDDDDGNSKKSSASAGDSSSIDSNEEKRLSNKVKKAWREVRGQSSSRDPLEQWMVKHSGGTFVEKPRRQVFGESPEK